MKDSDRRVDWAEWRDMVPARDFCKAVKDDLLDAGMEWGKVLEYTPGKLRATLHIPPEYRAHVPCILQASRKHRSLLRGRGLELVVNGQFDEVLESLNVWDTDKSLTGAEQ